MPSQQSIEDEQISPAAWHAERPLQRGTPKGSSWQAPLLPVAPQQLLRELEMLQA